MSAPEVKAVFDQAPCQVAKVPDSDIGRQCTALRQAQVDFKTRQFWRVQTDRPSLIPGYFLLTFGWLLAPGTGTYARVIM